MNRAAALFALVSLAQATVHGQSQDWRALMKKGNGLRHAGNFSEAVTAFQEAAKILEPLQTELFPFASALNSIATAYDDMDRPLEAEKYYRRALDVVVRVAGVRSVGRAQILVNLSCNYLHRADEAIAEKMLREALAIYDGLIPPESPLVAVARSYLAAALLQKGALDEAGALIDRSLPVIAKNVTDHEGIYGMTLNNLGSLRWEQNRRDEAILLFQQALEVLAHERDPESPAVLYPMNNLASAKFNTGDKEEAVALYSRAVRIAETKLGPDSFLYGHLLNNYAACLRKTGHKSEAKTMETRAAAALKHVPRPIGQGLTIDISALRARD